MIPSSPDNAKFSTRGYLIRALHEWCTDNGFTPYISVFVDANVLVPLEYVKGNEIVLNIAYSATTSMVLGNESIEFKARFGGQSRDVFISVGNVLAIYASENGQGMAFPPPVPSVDQMGGSKMPLKSPPAGLRLATGGGQQHTSHVPDVSLSVEVSEDSPDDSPTKPPHSGGNRPALKRVK
jgi:stringent starvation protein B